MLRFLQLQAGEKKEPVFIIFAQKKPPFHASSRSVVVMLRKPSKREVCLIARVCVSLYVCCTRDKKACLPHSLVLVVDARPFRRLAASDGHRCHKLFLIIILYSLLAAPTYAQVVARVCLFVVNARRNAHLLN